jgi:hypothetical protein
MVEFYIIDYLINKKTHVLKENKKHFEIHIRATHMGLSCKVFTFNKPLRATHIGLSNNC